MSLLVGRQVWLTLVSEAEEVDMINGETKALYNAHSCSKIRAIARVKGGKQTVLQGLLHLCHS